ncbi:zf-TFIIB domain-containing protein [Sphingomonas sp. DT-204]|uniref:TFIIB-type zinc ribbon-containing protein n=1 Tax=Sphingomonas sp. DT-204 TaxID=3396166 RepID=UPI003F1C777C
MTTTMSCPVCQTTLVPTVREAIEIDHCPSCRGVWLDRGELDKIIERSNAAFGGDRDRDDDRRRYEQPRRYDDDHRHKQHYKRKSFLSELFD